MTARDGARSVVTIDLATADLQDLLSRRFHETLVRLAPPAASPAVAPWRVVFVDRARDVAGHALVFERALSARLDIRVLCLLTGELGADGVLHRPDLFRRHENVGTLWIGNADGVAWGMETSTAADVFSGPSSVAYAAPPALLEALNRPEVFDAVLGAVRALPSAAAGPGLRAVRAEVAPNRLERGTAVAIARLVTRDGAWTREPAQLDIGRPGEYAGGQAIVRPGGKVDTHYLAATAGIRTLHGILNVGRGDLVSAAVDLGSALLALLDDADAVIDIADPRSCPDAVYRAVFDQLGLETAAAARGAGNPALDVLTSVGIDFFGQRGPLPVLSDRLRAAADRFAKPQRENYEGELARSGIRGAADRLGVLRTNPGSLRSRRALVGSFATTTVAAVLPGSAPAGAAVAVACAAGMLAALRSRLAKLRLAATFRTQAPRQAVAALAGAALGAAVSWLAGWTLWSGPARFAGGAVGAVSLTALVAVFSRRLFAADLRRALGIDRIGESVEKAKRLIEQTARSGRWSAERRYEVYDYARVLAVIVDELETALTEALRPSAAPAPAGTEREPAGIDAVATARLREQISDVDAVLLVDLSDVAATVFERCAARARNGQDIVMPAADEVKREAADRFADYLRFAVQAGVHRAPDECRDPAGRERLVATLWAQAGHLPDLIWAEAADERIRQFCEPEDLDFLEPDPRAARLVRFAPSAAANLVGGAKRPDRSAAAIEWTDDSRLLGVIRLVPLRSGVVSDDVQQADPDSVAETGVPGWAPSGSLALPAEEQPDPDFADDDGEDFED